MPARMSSSPPRLSGPRRATGSAEYAGAVAAGRPRVVSDGQLFAFGHRAPPDGRARRSPPRRSLGPESGPRGPLGHTVGVPATILDGKATAAAIRSELTDAGGRARRRRASPRASARCWSATTRAAAGTSPASTATAPRSASRRIQRELPADRHARPTSRPSSTSSTTTPRAPATSSSCRCPPGIDAERRARADGPGQGRRRPAPDRTSAGWCSACPAPLPCTPRGIVELLRRYDVPIAGAEVVVIGRGITVGRPLGLLLTRRTRERHGDAVPHRHPRPGRARAPGRHRRGRGRRARADHRRPGQAGRRRPRRRRQPASDGQDRRRRRAGRRRGGRATSPRCPAASAR